MKHKLSKRLTTVLTVVALLLLILPAGVLFADSVAGGDHQPTQTTTGKPTVEQPDDPDEDEPDENEPEELEDEDEGEPEGDAAEGEKSEQAILVAERIADAEILGIAPGKLNLIDKLLAALADSEAEDEGEPVATGETTDEHAARIAARVALLATFGKTDWNDVPVQDIMQAIKECRKPAVTESNDTGTAPSETEADVPAPGNKGNGKGQGKGNNKK